MANTFNNIFRGRSSQSVPFCLAVVLEGPLTFPPCPAVLQRCAGVEGAGKTRWVWSTRMILHHHVHVYHLQVMHD